MVLTNDNESSRRLVEQCYTRHKTTVNPIIDWTSKDVWEFIKENNIPYCKLYDEGFERLGCIGCPMARLKNRQREFARYPKYKTAYLMAFEKMIEARKKAGLNIGDMWGSAEGIFHWWIGDGVIPGQINMFEDEEQ